jgi:hypothetical protein
MAIGILTISAARGQDHPRTPCTFYGFSADPKLAEVAGDPMLVFREEGDWTCGYLSNRAGSSPGWVRSGDLRKIESDPSPPLRAWFGTWTYGEERIAIQASRTQGMLALSGKAAWHGLGDIVHYGQFTGEAAPRGSHLHFMDGGCTVDLTLIGKYVVATDNQMCGGANVRFLGIMIRKQS